MGSSFKLFSVGGIDIKMHITFPLILIWAAIQFGVLAGAGWTGALFGVIVVSLLFVIVTLHELGHSFAALRYDVPVQDIILLPIGGVAQLKRIPENPIEEFIIAIAGPAVNFVLAVLFLGIMWPLNIELQNPAVLLTNLESITLTNIFNFVFIYNLFLALFNLIPAFPLDGGRIFRSLLALRLPYPRATSIAVSVGRGFAFLLGLYGFLGGGFVLIILAIFIYIGAGQEGTMVQVRSILRGIRVGDAYSRHVKTLAPGDRLGAAAQLTMSSLQSSFPVCEEGHMLGVLSYPQLLEALDSQGHDSPVSYVMNRNVPTVHPETELVEAQEMLRESRSDALPVVDGDQFLGMITSQDISEVYRLLTAAPNLLSAVEQKHDDDDAAAAAESDVKPEWPKRLKSA
jgi:stage IV sporulation protein FB